jgi:hypothetical protein
VYQFGIGKKETSPEREALFYNINKYYILSSLANIAWVFAWHHGIIWLSLVFMLILLYSLIKISDVIHKETYDKIETALIRVPFSVYFGWITVATIANVTVLLVSLNWDGLGIADTTWTILILLVGAAIGIARMCKDKNIFYGLVLVWAYGGIWLKHTSASGFNGEYTGIITTVLICIALFLTAIGYVGYRSRK